jgi:hypothetical protein
MKRQEMIDRLINDEFDGMDYKNLWHYFEHYQQQEYADWTDEQLLNQYNEYFSNE